mgnify:CR=1 FL=1
MESKVEKSNDLNNKRSLKRVVYPKLCSLKSGLKLFEKTSEVKSWEKNDSRTVAKDSLK